MKKMAGCLFSVFVFCLWVDFCEAQEKGVVMSTPAAAGDADGEVNGNGKGNGADAEESAVVRPKWLERAERIYMEGLKAQEEGNDKLARKRFGSALKILASKADQDFLLSVKDDIALLFAKVEEYLLFLPEKPVTAPEDLDVSEQELEEVKADETPSKPVVKHYTIPVDPENPVAKKYIAIYTGRRKKSMQKALDRMGLYRDMIAREIVKIGLPRELIYLPLVESEFKNQARSRAGAVGLWQFMTGTGRRYGLKVNYWVDERRDPVKATRAALQHLKDLYEWFDDWHLALAAYNRGTKGIERDLKRTRATDYMVASSRKGLPRETENYVPKMMACILIADNAEYHGFRTDTGMTQQEVDEVVLEKPLDLKIAAKCAGIGKKEIEKLNPTVRLWCTPKNQKDFVFRIPAGKKKSFLAALSKVKNWNPAPEMIRYRVRRGDYLGRIARKYRTSVRAIMRQNKIRNPRRLRVGQTLVIRPGRKYRR